MARSSRLSVCLAITIRNSSKSIVPDRSAANAPRRQLRNRRALDHAGDGLALDVVELGQVPRRLSVQQTVRAPLVEVQHPISDDLKPDTANHRRLTTRRAIINCGERQISEFPFLVCLGLIGYWRGRNFRLSRYLHYLLSVLPADTRDLVIELAFGEAQERSSATRSAIVRK